MSSPDRMPLLERIRVRYGLEPRVVAVLALVAFIGVVFAVGVLWRGRTIARPSSPAFMSPVSESPQSTAQPSAGAPTPSDSSASAETSAVVVVDVAGDVARPGVVRLPAGARVVDAISAVGGVVPGADTSSVNLARLLVDGEQVVVGAPESVPGQQHQGQPTSQEPASTAAGAPIDLNAATAAELESLPGIGPVLAGRIVDWRERNGRFSSIDELNEVSGVGEATFAELAPLVRV